MAAGCWVVGYHGGGGKELFRFGGAERLSLGWSGFIAAIGASSRSLRWLRETAMRLERQALAVKALYSPVQERASIASAWERIGEAFQIWRQSVAQAV